LEKKPFCKQTLADYEKRRNSQSKLGLNNYGSNNTNLLNSPKKLLASPNRHSKFSPSINFGKSPTKNSPLESQMKEEDSKNILLQLSGVHNDGKKRTEKKSVTLKMNETSPFKLLSTKPIQVNRKERNNLINLKNNKDSTKNIEKEYNDLPIVPAFKQMTSKVINTSGEDMIVDSDNNNQNYFDENSFTEEEPVKYEGYLYKVTENRQLKKLWFSLLHKDLYCKILKI
jgi:hypothetical protein